MDICSKVADALVALITAANVGTETIYSLVRSGEKDAPCVGCGAENANEGDPAIPGNFWVDAMVQVKYIAAVDADGADPKDSAHTLDEAVLTALERDDLAAALTAAVPDFTVFGFDDGKEINRSQEGDVWILTWKQRMYCCCSALS